MKNETDDRGRVMPVRALSIGARGRAALWAMRAVRVGLVATAVVASFGFVAFRVGEARAATLGQAFGDELLTVGESRATGELSRDFYKVQLNGQTLYSSNARTPMAMRDVLNYFADQCKTHATGLRETFKDIDGSLAKLDPTTGAPGALIVHKEADDRGYVFCVAPDHGLSMPELIERMGRLDATGDFATVGDMRYVVARKTPNGTRVVTAWTEGTFDVSRMFDPSGDVPGEDFGNVPRPDGARRTVSATIEGGPGGLNGYLVKGTPAEVRAQVDRKLSAAGWRSLPIPAAIKDAPLTYSFGSSLDLVVTTDALGADSTSVGYLVSRSIGHSTH
jgi:hypothetical protein